VSSSVLRSTFLYLSRQKQLRQWVETSSQAERMTSRFIAGLHLEDGLRVTRQLAAGGISTSLDHLGENVTTTEEAVAARDAYLRALQRIGEEKLPVTISVKLTSLGLDLSEDLCRANASSLLSVARDMGTRVEFDMEDSSYTDRTLAIVRDMHSLYGCVRAVVQAYLYRTEADVEDLSARGIPVRLCKGAYQEPPTVAWPDKAAVDQNFVKLMRLAFDKGTYPAIATHDDAMVGQTLEYICQRGITADRFEFQMLYGIRRDLQQEVVSRGYRLRLYVPYGTAWYPYFMRRLAERPANVMFLAKSVFKG
jgi:proline dehydrogenase